MSPLFIGALVALGCALSALIPLGWAIRAERQTQLARELLRESISQRDESILRRTEAEQDIARWRELWLAERRANPPDKRLTTKWRG